MKIFILFLSQLIFVLNGFGQIEKRYETKKGKMTDDPKKAAFYYLVREKNDTTYVATKFDMFNNLLFIGYFKDEAIQIPNGDFDFFGNLELLNPATGTKIIGKPYVFIAGHFENGKKTGQWFNYGDRGRKIRSRFYKNDKLNGFYQDYDPDNGQLTEDGNFVDDKREGEVNTYVYNKPKPNRTYVYKNNVVVQTILHNKAPQAPEDFDKYIKKAVEPFFDYLKENAVLINISIDENGRADSLLNANTPLSQEIAAAITKALLNAPKFNPGIDNDLPSRQVYNYNFKFGSFGTTFYGKEFPTGTKEFHHDKLWDNIDYTATTVGFVSSTKR